MGGSGKVLWVGTPDAGTATIEKQCTYKSISANDLMLQGRLNWQLTYQYQLLSPHDGSKHEPAGNARRRLYYGSKVSNYWATPDDSVISCNILYFLSLIMFHRGLKLVHAH